MEVTLTKFFGTSAFKFIGTAPQICAEFTGTDRLATVLKPFPHLLSANLRLNPQLVRDHRDEFAVGWLRLGVGDCVAKQAGDGVKITTGPRNLNGVANGTFYTAGSGVELFGDVRVQHLCNRAEQLHIVVYHGNRFTQIQITFDVRRNANLMDNTGDAGVEVTSPHLQGRLRFYRSNKGGCRFGRNDLTDALCQHFHVERLENVVSRTEFNRFFL